MNPIELDAEPDQHTDDGVNPSAMTLTAEEDRPVRASRRFDRALRIVGASMVVACLLLAANTALAYQGLPHVASSAELGPFPTGRHGVRLLTALSGVVILLAVITRRLRPLQWAMVLSLGLWLAIPSLTQYMAGYSPGRHFVGLAIMAVGVGAGAALAGMRLTRWLVFTTGAAWAAISIALGVVALQFGDSLPLALSPDPTDRYTQWLRLFGLSLEDGTVDALAGLSRHRQLLGMMLAVAVVVQVRHLLTVGGPWHRRPVLAIIGPGCTAFALAWTLSRTAVTAAAIGLILSLLPWERLGQALGSALLGAVALILPVLPLIFDGRILEATGGSGTVAWRVWVWRGYFADDGLWRFWGIGPKHDVPLGAAHAHNEVLQTLVVGGWIGTAALVLFILLASWAALRAAQLDRRTSLATLITAAMIMQFEVITPSIWARELNPALILIIAVVVSAGEIGGRDTVTRDAPTTVEDTDVQVRLEAVAPQPRGTQS